MTATISVTPDMTAIIGGLAERVGPTSLTARFARSYRTAFR